MSFVTVITAKDKTSKTLRHFYQIIANEIITFMDMAPVTYNGLS